MEFNYREELKNSYRKKKSLNPSYSLRAFSRDLGVSSTTLSDVLSGKRNLSKTNAQKVADKLGFSPEEHRAMLAEIQKKTLDFEIQQEIIQIAEDEFNLISNWFYLAILTLSQQKGVDADSGMVAERLGIKENQAKNAIETLERLDLIKVKRGKLVRTSLPLRTTSDVPSYAIKNYHRENLEVARFNLDNTSVELREISSMNLNIDPNKISIAKKMINDFKERFTIEMEKTKAKEVYTLAMHFFPANIKRNEEDA